MVTLAVDTSHATGAVTLARDDAVLGTERFEHPASHLVALSHAVERLLAGASLQASAVERVAIVVGPGSFTGLRIGLAFAKGLHAASGAAIVPIDSLRLLALPLLARHERACAMVDARRGEVYAALYARASGAATGSDTAAAHEMIAPCAQTPGTLIEALPRGREEAPAIFVGTGALASRDAILAAFPGARFADPPACLPSTEFLARIAAGMRALDEAAVRGLEPLYVRPSGAERVRLRSHARRPGDPGKGPGDE